MYICVVNRGRIAALHYPYHMVASLLQMLLHHGYVVSLVYNLFPLSNFILKHTVNFFQALVGTLVSNDMTGLCVVLVI